jgi:hypothetical protein
MIFPRTWNYDYLGCHLSWISDQESNKCRKRLSHSLECVEEIFYVFHDVGDCGKVVFVLLSIQNIDYQKKFKMAMVHNVKPLLCEDNKLNPITKL